MNVSFLAACSVPPYKNNCRSNVVHLLHLTIMVYVYMK